MLWQKDRATLASFSSNVQLDCQNHKIAFLSHRIGIRGNMKYKYFSLSESFKRKNFVGKFYS